MSEIYVVGIGPGGIEDMTPRAQRAIEKCEVIIGYDTYIELIKEHYPDKNYLSSGMRGEVKRCELSLKKAEEGSSVALISSGDSGIYGMAGLMLEILDEAGSDVEVHVVPGVTAASAAAAVLGAPLMNDFATVSLSDYLTPWDAICKRIECAAMSDFVVCLYNPKSKSRTEHIATARDILLKHKESSTPVGIVRNAGRREESFEITSLEKMLDCDIDMFSTVIVGNSQTYVSRGKMITPRGYKVPGRE